MKHVFKSQLLQACLLYVISCMYSCTSSIKTPSDIHLLADFHVDNYEQQETVLDGGSLNLFIDYSTCNLLGQHSKFFQEVSASLVNKTTTYYSIKGSQISKENLSNNNVYTLLRNIEEVNYAELAKAADMMADAYSESVMITDGEYYTPSIAKGHDNDPYLANAFKKWILKGYDIHIISEPYVESYRNVVFNKKRFYIIFTDDRMRNNIYDRICRTVDFTQFPDVDEFHISASHPQLQRNGDNCSSQNELLLSRSKGYGTFEIEDWNGCEWNTIEDLLVNACDEKTGTPLENGAPIIKMEIDKNSFGCYRIQSLNLKVYDINQEYTAYYEGKTNGLDPLRINYPLVELENFMWIDSEVFDRNSIINIHFKTDWFDPNVLTGQPYNYFKVDLSIGEILPIFAQHEERFEFESISQPGTKNVSIASSIKQCLADDEVIKKIKGQVIYSIYIKSEQN